MTKKMTRIEALNAALLALTAFEEEDANAKEAMEVLGKMRDSLQKRSDAPRGTSKTRLENEKLLAQMLDLMEEDEGYTAGSFVGRVQFVTTPQKATAILRLGVANGSLVCEKEGKANKYRLA